MTVAELAGSIAGGDSLGEAVDWLRLEELSSAIMSIGNKETLGLVKRGVRVSVTQKEDMVENILCFQNITWRKIRRHLERGSQQ